MIDRPLRFCMITTFYPPYNFGGDGIFVRQLSNELARRGHHVEVIHCLDSYQLLAEREPSNTYNDHPNVKVHGLKSRFGFLSPLATQQTGYPLLKSAKIKKILENGFDVIHYHNISLVGGPKILEYGQGIKLYTIHEYWLFCPTHVLFRFNRSACVKPYCFLCTLAYKRPPQWWRYFGLLKGAVKHVDAFIAPSRFAGAINRHMGIEIPVRHIPNFVPETELAPSTPEIPIHKLREEPYFLFVGRLEKLKGLQTIIPAFRHYRNARLFIAGIGKYEPELQQLAAGDENIRFLGHVPQMELQSLYRQAVAVILPSMCFEIFPLVIIEAFSQKTPVIARNLGGMPEIVEESGGGFIYNTEEQLLSAMERLLSEPSYRDQLGLHGYETYKRKWTPEAHAQDYFALIREIATANGRTLV